MKRMIGRTRLVTMMRAAGAAVLAVGVAGSAFAADQVDGAAPAAKPLTTAASLAVTTPDDKAAPDKKEEGQDPPANPMVEFLKQTEISGFVDGYYLWAFNETAPQLRNFDINHNSFSLNYVEVAFAKPVSETSRGGFRVDFGAGDTADLVNLYEPGGTNYLKYVQQAYVSYLAPVGKGLTIDFGKFVTPAGAEVIENKDNFNYSRGLLFALAIP
jgi:opacity protein-like surface antigen